MNNNLLSKIGIGAIIFVAGIMCGLFVRSSQKPIIIKETKIKWKDKIVYREYSKMDRADLYKKLKLYDTSAPRLKIYQIKNDEIKADAGLYQRNWSGTAKIKISENNNFMYYFGVGTVCFAVGILIAMRYSER